ncbi:hypothetical protein HanXRQr2_Chr11g0496081 [Helianthus annuus]|uniref:Uncharacterized protein n=1 Tax=Helianthus annuus TaxID=4232 RepID=A0A9K3HQH5_HELAN|nr:hypothetical protein HanXRQr2_Chr11g0496081 [Helianthus annuus]KAJ0875583.1 hypothetical protein HanPSC8_Chr11g0478121 [Helianthus annuus]
MICKIRRVIATVYELLIHDSYSSPNTYITFLKQDDYKESSIFLKGLHYPSPWLIVVFHPPPFDTSTTAKKQQK